jgi:hypothetical protein
MHSSENERGKSGKSDARSCKCKTGRSGPAGAARARSSRSTPTGARPLPRHRSRCTCTSHLVSSPPLCTARHRHAREKPVCPNRTPELRERPGRAKEYLDGPLCLEGVDQPQQDARLPNARGHEVGRHPRVQRAQPVRVAARRQRCRGEVLSPPCCADQWVHERVRDQGRQRSSLTKDESPVLRRFGAGAPARS